MENTVLQTAPSFVCLLTENNVWNFTKEFASPVIALLALGFAIYTHIKTQKLIYPFQRPIIGINKTHAVTSEGTFDNNNKYKYIFSIELRNKGKLPAQDLILKINYFASNEQEKIIQSANRIDQDSDYTITAEAFTKIKITKENKLLIKLGLIYKDLLQPKNEYEEYHWYKFTGGNEINHATIEEKELIEKTAIK